MPKQYRFSTLAYSEEDIKRIIKRFSRSSEFVCAEVYKIDWLNAFGVNIYHTAKVMTCPNLLQHM